MTDTADILKKILDRKKEEIGHRKQRLSTSDLEQRIKEESSAPRGFYKALRDRVNAGKTGVIAEIKKASPSKGIIREDFQPAQIAVSYAMGGATCLSVLTDRDFFQGAEANLTMARTACPLPVLRKDFIIDPYQVVESRAIDADCILLIAAALEHNQLQDLSQLAAEFEMDVLVEVHNQHETEQAVDLDLPMIGINNRNLHTFKTSLQTTLDLKTLLAPEQLLITESGIHSPADVALMRGNGIHCFLIGEEFMRADDPGSRLREMFP